MKFLIQPLTLSFLSSTAGVACLAFTDFEFNERFFFRPLMVVMVMTYIIGAFFLPILLTKLDFDFLRLVLVSCVDLPLLHWIAQPCFALIGVAWDC